MKLFNLIKLYICIYFRVNFLKLYIKTNIIYSSISNFGIKNK